MLVSVNVTQARQRAALLANQIAQAPAPTDDSLELAVDELGALAVASEPGVAQAGSRALFGDVVETLADRFDSELCDHYIRVFSRLIATCRRHSGLRKFEERLGRFGLDSEQTFLRRAERVRRPGAFDVTRCDAVRKAFVLSRVTLGADVAVSSVVLDKMKRTFPHAEVVFLAGEKAGRFFASDRRIRLREVAYRREGSLLDRLNAWPTLIETMEQETAGLRPEEYVLVDPDSRLTQLGLLPLITDDSRYFFFESRSFTAPGATALADLTGRWLETVFGEDGQRSLPYVSLAEQEQSRGRHFRDAAGGRRIAAVNLGVADNDAKRVPDPFESELLQLLLLHGYAVVLDQGAGEDELTRTARLVQEIEVSGASVARIEGDVRSIADLNVWRGSLSGFAGLIAASDLYVGYDSAGGHLAAALGVPGIDIFAGASSARMVERWHPWGLRPGGVIAVDARQTPEQVLNAVRERLP